MGEKAAEKLVFISTFGGEDPERASSPFVWANAALAMDCEVVVILQGTAVTLAVKGCYEHVFAPHKPPLKELVDNFLEMGGTLLACTPCLQERQITQDQLIESVQTIKAARLITECLEAVTTVCM